MTDEPTLPCILVPAWADAPAEVTYKDASTCQDDDVVLDAAETAARGLEARTLAA